MGRHFGSRMKDSPAVAHHVALSCRYMCLDFVTFLPALSLAKLVPLSRVTAEKIKKKEEREERGHSNREQERKEGRVQALK